MSLDPSRFAAEYAPHTMDAASLEIDHARDGDRAVITLAGELDLATAPELETALAEALDGGDRPAQLVVDLRALGFMDSTGLRVLLVTHARAAEEGWDFALVRGSEAVQRVFEITRMSERLTFVDPPAE